MRIRLTLLFFVFLTISLLGANVAQSQTLYRANSGTKRTLNAVWFWSDSSGVSVGDSAIISVSFNGGNTWQLRSMPLSEPFAGNFYTEFLNDSANGSIAGDNGTIFTIIQSDYLKITLPDTNAIYGMTFPSYDTGVVCGAAGLFYMTTDSGKTWNKKTLPVAAQKYDYHGTDYFDDDTYWLVGQKGIVLYTEDDGKNWQQITVPTTKDLYSIYFPDDGSSTGWIVGDSTLLITIDGGDNWASIGSPDSLRSVAGWDSTDAYAVGLNGKIIYTSNRSNWNTLPTGTSANLYGFDYTDDWLYFAGDSGIILTTLPPVVQPPIPNFVLEGDDTVPGSELTFGNILDGTNSEDNASLYNVSAAPITITRISSDSSDFIIDTASYLDINTPFILDSGSARLIGIIFTPPTTSTIQTFHSTLRVVSSNAGERDIPLTAVGVPNQGSVAITKDAGQLNILLSSGMRSTFIQCPNTWIGPIRLEVFNLIGISVYSTNDVLTSGANVLPSSLPPGAYMYRLSSSTGSQVGKCSIE